MTKRIIAVFLVVFMILVFSVSAFAAIDFGFEICSSDGTQTLYFQESTCLTSLTVTETGALLEYLSPMDSTKTLTYTFTYNGESFPDLRHRQMLKLLCIPLAIHIQVLGAVFLCML